MRIWSPLTDGDGTRAENSRSPNRASRTKSGEVGSSHIQWLIVPLLQFPSATPSVERLAIEDHINLTYGINYMKHNEAKDLSEAIQDTVISLQILDGQLRSSLNFKDPEKDDGRIHFAPMSEQPKPARMSDLPEQTKTPFMPPSPARNLIINTRARLADLDLTMNAFALSTGFPQKSLWWILNAKGSPTIETATKLSKALGVALVDLLSEPD